MAKDTARQDLAHPDSGVTPVLFSASTDTHDTVMLATDRDAMRRSPFGTDTVASAAGE